MKTDARKEHEDTVRRKWEQLGGLMDERVARRWAAAEADAIGHGGLAIVARATGIALSTIGVGRRELRAGVDPDDLVKVRRRGGGRRPQEVAYPTLVEELLKLVDPVTRGDPESPLRWTSKGTEKLAQEIRDKCKIPVSARTVARLLIDNDYSLQAPSKSIEGKQHPDRNAQFEYINAKAEDCIQHGIPFISVDTKKKELVGNFKNGGREWQPEGTPDLTDVHDFPHQAIGKAIPYGVFDVVDNSAFVNVGTDHDTATFAVVSIETWWKRMGRKRYPNAKELFITADAGGSNGYRLRLWKLELQRLADKLGISIHVSHFPPGTSKWNKIEHRLFSIISMNWRGRPLRTYETVVSLISNTKTSTGLIVKARMDDRSYPLKTKVSAKEMRELNIEQDDFHGEWNYTIRPRAQ